MFSRKGINQIMKLGLIVLVLCILPSISLVKGENYQIKSYLGEEPIIDGYIDDIERQSTGKSTEVILPWDTWNMGGDQVPITVEIGSFHTNTSHLYLNTRIYYEDIIGSNITYFLRKKGTDDNFDLKRINSITNSSLDGYRTPYKWNINDTEFGGTQDSEGKCYLTNDSLTFELFMPYNSSDVLGHDLNVTLNDEIELEIYLYFTYPTPYGVSNSYQWSEDDNCTIIFIDSEAAPISIIGIILGLIVIPVVKITMKNLTLNKNKRKICDN
ncbi:MAG: hypothetical protein FK730_14570 [Asgard group archaeon]|nr:hypothetical protein [Asgard group archaeon]